MPRGVTQEDALERHAHYSLGWGRTVAPKRRAK